MGATSQLSSIGIGRLVWPYRWIKWTNATLSSIVLILVASTISTLLKGDLASVYWLAAGLALLAFPGWIAWRKTARLFRLRDALQGTPWGPALSLLDDASSIRSVVFRPHGRITVVRSSSRGM